MSGFMRYTGLQRLLAVTMAVSIVGAPLAALAEENLDLAMPGARARAMGGAYTAVAEDLSALFWNPAGIAGSPSTMLQADLRLTWGGGSVDQAPTEFDTGVGIVPVAGFSDNPGSDFTYYLLGGATRLPWDFAERHSVTGALGYRRIIDLGFSNNQVLQFDQGGGTIIPWEFTNNGEGGINGWTFTLAGAPHERVQLGANFNLLTGAPEGVTENSVTFSGITVFSDETTVKQSVGGYSFDIGLKARVLDQLDVGAVLRPGYDIELTDGTLEQIVFVGAGAPGLEPGLNRFAFNLPDQRLEVPLCWSVGAALRPTHWLLLTGDYHYKPWNELKVFVDDASGNEVLQEVPFYETHSFHVGGELMTHLGKVHMPIRGGFRTTPTVRANVDSLSADVDSEGFRTYRGDRVQSHTVTLGLGVHFETVHFDIGYDRTRIATADYLLGAEPLPGQALRLVEVDQTLSSLYFTSTLFYR